jgi:macrolide-specific efflux system membrane fusion protein
VKWKVLLIVALLAGGSLAIGASLGVFGASAASGSTQYLTAQAAVGDVVAQVAATGSVAPATSWGLSFGDAAHSASSSSSSAGGAGSITWPVTAVKVAVGDRVTKGAVLATAATTDLDAQIANALRALRSARIQLSQANDQLSAATTTAATRQAKTGVYNAETAEANAHQAYADLVTKRALASLVAPSDGIVTAVSITAGSDAASGDAIQIAATPLEVTTSVVEKDVASISVGQPADVTISALSGSTLQGTVISIAPTASSGGSSGVVSYDVEIALSDTPAGLRPGMTADVTITTASATGVLSIPARALLGTTGAYRVRVLAADGTVTPTDVTVGLITDSLVEIKSGLQAGDRVITGTSSSQNGANGANGGGGTIITNGKGFPGGGGGTFRGPGG